MFSSAIELMERAGGTVTVYRTVAPPAGWHRSSVAPYRAFFIFASHKSLPPNRPTRLRATRHVQHQFVPRGWVQDFLVEFQFVFLHDRRFTDSA
jgi:hypothetical protein